MGPVNAGDEILIQISRDGDDLSDIAKGHMLLQERLDKTDLVPLPFQVANAPELPVFIIALPEPDKPFGLFAVEVQTLSRSTENPGGSLYLYGRAPRYPRRQNSPYGQLSGFIYTKSSIYTPNLLGDIAGKFKLEFQNRPVSFCILSACLWYGGIDLEIP